MEKLINKIVKFFNLEREFEIARREMFKLPLTKDNTEGSKDIADWQPRDLRPFRKGKEIVWKE